MSEIRVGKNAQPDEAGRIAERRRLDRDQGRVDLKSALQHPHVRRYLWNLIRMTGAVGVPTPARESALMSAYEQGVRSVGCMVFEDILAADPSALLEGIRGEADRVALAKSKKE